MSDDKSDPGLLETLLADVEWSAGTREVRDARDPEGWRPRGLRIGDLLSCLVRPGFHATALHRLSRWCRKRGLSPVSYGIQLLNQAVTGAEISHNAEIGPGLRILHPMGVYVGAGARVGFRSTFNQGSSVQKNLVADSGNPVCGNYLDLAPGAKVLGGVRLGDRVWVGPNSAAVSDVDDDTRVLGVPAKPMGKDERLP
jgi:serine O-acetyltransferase